MGALTTESQCPPDVSCVSCWSASRQHDEVVDISYPGSSFWVQLSLYRASAPRLSFSGRVEVLVQASVRVVWSLVSLIQCLFLTCWSTLREAYLHLQAPQSRMEVVRYLEHSLRRPNVLETRVAAAVMCVGAHNNATAPHRHPADHSHKGGSQLDLEIQ